MMQVMKLLWSVVTCHRFLFFTRLGKRKLKATCSCPLGAIPLNTNRANYSNQIQLSSILLIGSLLLLIFSHASLIAEPAPAEKEAQNASESAAQKSKTDLSDEAEKEVRRYMDFVLEDPQNQFAFDQVYEIYESEKKTWKLLEFFQNAARLDRKSGNLQLLLGMMYMRFRDYYQAAEHFQNGLKLLPKSYYGRLMLGRVYLKQSEMVKASEFLADAVNAASSISEQVEALFLLGDALMLATRAEEAKKAWAQIQDLQRYEVPTLQQLARVYKTYQFPELSDGILQQILDLAENDPQLKSNTYLRRASLQQELDNKPKGIEYLQEAKKLLLPNSARRKEIEDLIRRLYTEDNRLAEFFDELESQVQERPNDVELRKEISRHYSASEQVDRASVHLSRGVEIDSRDVLLLEHAARVYRAQKKTEVAAKTLNRLYEITGGAPNYLIETGDILWENEQKDEAMNSWKRVVKDDPDNPSRYQNVIRAYRNQKLSVEALALYKDLLGLLSSKLEAKKAERSSGRDRDLRLDLAESYEETKLALANYLLSLNLKDEAKQHLAELTTNDQAPASLYLQIGDLYENYDMTDELREVLDKGLTHFAEDSRLARQKGFALESQQNYKEAIEMFLQAYDHAPNWRDKESLMDKLISLHLAQGGLLQSLEPLVLKLYQDLQKDKDNAEPYIGLARITSVHRPTAESGYRDQEIVVKGLAAITDDWSVDYFGLGQLATVRNFGKALDHDPMRIDAYVGRARAFMFFDEFEKAVLEYKKLAIVNPVGKWKYYFAIGDFFASQGQMPEAAAFWGRVAERAFTDADLYFRLATRYYWAQRPQRAVQLLQKAISIYPDNYRYYLALGNMFANLGEYELAISSYRDALQRSVQTMLLPVRRIMSQTQVKYAHSLFSEGKYKEALEVYEEIARFQEVMNKHLGSVVPDYPDIRAQILRTQAKLAGDRSDSSGLAELGKKYPSANCWVSDHLEMSIDYLAELSGKGEFNPNMNVPAGKTELSMPTLEQAYATRVFPWVFQAKLSPSRIHLTRRYEQAVLDTASGKVLTDSPRSGQTLYFGNQALDIGDGKLSLSDLATGNQLWQVAGNWFNNAAANSQLLVGLVPQGQLQAIDRKTGKLLWQVPSCEEFRVTEKYVTVKRVKKWLSSDGGLEDHAHGDTDSIGYIFQVLEATTGETVFDHSSSGSHYWRVPVVAGGLVLLTDGFAHKVYAHDIGTGQLRWVALFDSFFAREPLLVDGEVHLFMRRPKLKTIIQYALNATTGDILRMTDLRMNSLFASPVVLGGAVYFFDPETFEVVATDRKRGGLIGRTSVKNYLTRGAHKYVITMEGLEDSLFFYTQDGLIVKLRVQEK